MSDLSHLPRIKADLGKAQWVEAKCTGIDPTIEERTHTFGVPYLMPCTMIFVHGVNSEGEWYRDAAEQFAKGLNVRLGRTDLRELEADPRNMRRFLRVDKDGVRYRSPIIPFYWGYSVAKEDRNRLDDRADVIVDRWGNPLRADGTWGGGPFQNGTTNLAQFWAEEGFRKNMGAIDVDAINPIVGRKLFDCPNRLYYVHAARRLANLVKTIREDFPHEPINLIPHSQGTMVALCALFFMDEWGVRAPDTVMLNSSPYRFDNYYTDYLSASSTGHDVATVEARVHTFAKAAAIVANAKTSYQFTPMPRVPCTHKPRHKHIYDDKVFARMPDDTPDWQADLGVGKVDKDGRKWWQHPLHSRDNRGSLFVNFNPADRVIGVSAIEGIGWRGIPSRYLNAESKPLGGNVMQRLFARSSNPQYNPAVGSKTEYRQAYFYQQIEAAPTHVGIHTRGEGYTAPIGYEGWQYLDGQSAKRAWKVAPEKLLGVVDALGTPSISGGQSEAVYINAPLVPVPAVLGDDFDGKAIRYDGQAQEADPTKNQQATSASDEQQADYADDLLYQAREEITVEVNGRTFKRRMTDSEVAQRRRQQAGHVVISPTNHSAFLRYSPDGNSGTVQQVLSYDLTVGRSYAYGDEAYWNYLLDLADWRRSDPYYKSGVLQEKAGTADAPKGIVTATVPLASQNVPGERWPLPLHPGERG